jgi:Domain of unknown function (DUF4173)
LTAAEFTVPDLKSLQTQANRHLMRLAFTLCLALFCGFIAQQGWPGSAIALAPLGLLALLAFKQNQKGWNRNAVAAAIMSSLALLAVLIEPGPLNLAVMWAALAGLSMVGQGMSPGNLYELAKTAAHKLFGAPAQLFKDVGVHRAIRNQMQAHPRLLTLANMLLPVLAITVFGVLLIVANPLIETSLAQFSWGAPWEMIFSWTPLVTIISFFLIWSVMRMVPKPARESLIGPKDLWGKKFAATGSVAFTLLLLNAMFAFENILDFKYIWSGQALPPGTNFAEYVHRGSYTLIATAILAGALVLYALQPGSNTEKSRPVRWLVYAWTAQNIALVASSVMRTLDYVDAYGMTLWRFAGLIWMALVAAGLLLIILRIIKRRGHLWLVNANLGTAFAVLLVCGFIDFSGIVAQWNVSRALKNVTAQALALQLNLDIPYLVELGPSSLPALQRLQQATHDSFSLEFQTRQLEAQRQEKQSDWRHWTMRGHRLQSVERQ